QATVAETRPVQPTVPTLAAQIAAPTPEPAAPEAALQNLQAEVAVASFTPGPTALVLAAAGTGLAPPLPAEPYADLADIQTLAETLDAAQAESIRFIEKWDAIGNECAARADRFLGALSAACQKIRTAQRRGEIFRFGFECYRLAAIHEELFEHYRLASMRQQLPAEVETALHANER